MTAATKRTCCLCCCCCCCLLLWCLPSGETGSSLVVVLRALSLSHTLSLLRARSLFYALATTLPLALLLLSLSLSFALDLLFSLSPLLPFSPLLFFLPSFSFLFFFFTKKTPPLPSPPSSQGTCFFIHKPAFIFFWVGGQSFFAPFPLLFFPVTETLPQLLLLSSFPGGTTAHTITGRLFLPVALCPPSLSRDPPWFSAYFLFIFYSFFFSGSCRSLLHLNCDFSISTSIHVAVLASR